MVLWYNVPQPLKNSSGYLSDEVAVDQDMSYACLRVILFFFSTPSA